MADVPARTELRVTTGPIRGSRKIHVGPRKVAMRAIDLEPSSGEPPLNVYDTSGPYSDPAARIDIMAGLPQLRRDYRLEDTLTIAGASNGGISAFQIATRYPDAFRTVIGYPGMLDRSVMPRAFLLKSMCTFMHVGDRDAWWVANMQAQAKALEMRGVHVTLTVEKNQNHGLKAAEINLSNRLFDEIESCRH